jgi:putative hemolysin
MSASFIDIFVILLLIAINGVLSMSELAILAVRRTRLEERANAGERGARVALTLLDNQSEFLSTVQVGITLVGILAGALGGANLSNQLEGLLVRIPYVAEYSNSLSVGLVVLVITYLSLVIGELVPKRLALNNAEGIAITMAPLMQLIADHRPRCGPAELVHRHGFAPFWRAGQHRIAGDRRRSAHHDRARHPGGRL